MNAFIVATLAAARANLHRARVAQENALIFAIDVYCGGSKGREAKRMREHWDRKRAAFLREALRERANWKALRRLSVADTVPAAPASETRRVS